MRYTQCKAFEKHLESAAPDNLSALYCLISKDATERALAFNELKRVLFLKEPKLDFKIYSADVKGEQELLLDLNTPSLLASKQLLHLPGIEKFSKSFLKTLEKELSALPKLVTLVLSGEALNRQTSFYKAVEKHGIVLDIVEEKPWEKERSMAEWLMQRIATAGKTMAPDAVQTLIQGSSGNLACLANEWEKLLTYVGTNKNISEQDVRAICILTGNDSSWLLGEAILQSNTSKALAAAHSALDQGNSLFAMLRQIRHQCMTALQLASASQAGEMHTIAEKFPYLKGHFLDKQLALATQYGIPRLVKAIQLLDFYEFKAKDQWDDPKLLLNLLIGRL